MNHPAALPVLVALCAFAYWADREITTLIPDPVAGSHWEIVTK